MNREPKTSVTPHPETSVDSRKVASEIREHLNSVGYDLGIDTIPLIKQVIDVEYKRAALTDSRGAGAQEALKRENEELKEQVKDMLFVVQSLAKDDDYQVYDAVDTDFKNLRDIAKLVYKGLTEAPKP